MDSRNAVCVIVHDRASDQVVALHYASGEWATHPEWTLPGGKVDPGEAADQAAVRELREETGLSVATGDLDLVHVNHVQAGWDGLGPFVLFTFATSTWSGELVNAEPAKHLAVRWAGLDDLPQPLYATSATAVAAYRNGGPRFARAGW